MAGTSYFKIYNRAVTEFKDPTLKKLLYSDTILFSQSMYNFLENAISLFTNPGGAANRIKQRAEPVLTIESFTATTVTKEFELVNPPNPVTIDDCIFQYIVDDIQVDGSYSDTTSTITLVDNVDQGSVFTSNIYYIGNFNLSLYDEEEYLLSQFILSCWSEYINNDKLDIIRLLGDTDFKLPSNSATTTSKVNWHIVNRETVMKRMNKYAWDSRFNRTY